MPDNSTRPAVTSRHRAALQAATNGVRQQALMLDNPHDYITETEAGLIMTIAALYMQVGEVKGGVNLGAASTMGNSAQTAGHAAVDKALSSVADNPMAALVALVDTKPRAVQAEG